MAFQPPSRKPKEPREDKKQEESGTMSARTIFGNRDKYGQSDLTTKLNTTHQNQVSLSIISVKYLYELFLFK